MFGAAGGGGHVAHVKGAAGGAHRQERVKVGVVGADFEVARDRGRDAAGEMGGQNRRGLAGTDRSRLRDERHGRDTRLNQGLRGIDADDGRLLGGEVVTSRGQT